MITLLLFLMLAYLIYRSHTVTPVVLSHQEPVITPDPVVSHDTLTLLLMHEGKIKHEIALHQATHPDTYEYGGVAYRYYGKGQHGLIYVS